MKLFYGIRVKKNWNEGNKFSYARHRDISEVAQKRLWWFKLKLFLHPMQGIVPLINNEKLFLTIENMNLIMFHITNALCVLETIGLIMQIQVHNPLKTINNLDTMILNMNSTIFVIAFLLKSGQEKHYL